MSTVGAPQRYRGERLGLPQSGPGSISTAGLRVGALIVDCIASALVAGLFVAGIGRNHDIAHRLPGSWSLIPFAVDYVVGLVLSGQTLGMHLCGIRVVRVGDQHAGRRILPLHAAARTLLLMLLVPAVIVDKDGRGLHDRATGTAVVRA
jgi:uncharacterized RDD family membrane protein YckC